jgi:hypothetical protein
MNPVTTNARGARIEIDPLVYIDCPEKSAFLLNLGEGGIAIQAMDVLQPGRSLHFSFPLPESESAIGGQARIVWSDQSGRAGLQFVNMTPLDELKLASWIAIHGVRAATLANDASRQGCSLPPPTWTSIADRL